MALAEVGNFSGNRHNRPLELGVFIGVIGGCV
jgi:hypothetical protein